MNIIHTLYTIQVRDMFAKLKIHLYVLKPLNDVA